MRIGMVLLQVVDGSLKPVDLVEKGEKLCQLFKAHGCSLRFCGERDAPRVNAVILP